MQTKHPGILELSKLKTYPADIKKLEGQLKEATQDEQKILGMKIVALKYAMLEEYNKIKL
jgi:hypothetical protein